MKDGRKEWHDYTPEERARQTRSFVLRAAEAFDRGEHTSAAIDVYCAIGWVLEPRELKHRVHALNAYKEMIKLLSGTIPATKPGQTRAA